MLNDFVLPYTRIRDRKPGYAVSMLKAGMTVTGHPRDRTATADRP
ncbi:hypothetical protein [Streptomyces sp. NPDC046805]